MNETIGEKIMGTVGAGFVVCLGVAAMGWFGANGWMPDTPKQHQERLQCEMSHMESGYQQKGMAAADAEAYCDKEMQTEKIWNAQNKEAAK